VKGKIVDPSFWKDMACALGDDEVMAEVPDLPCAKHYNVGDMVQILVGPAQHQMDMNEYFISSSSPELLTTALKIAPLDGGMRCLNLTREDPEVCRHGFYESPEHVADNLTRSSKRTSNTSDTGKCSMSEHRNRRKPQTVAIFEKHMSLRSKLYCVGERMYDIRLRNAFVDEFCRVLEISDEVNVGWLPALFHADLIYAETSLGPPARRMIVDCCIKFYDLPTLSSQHIENNVFLNDFMRAYFRITGDHECIAEFRKVPLMAKDYHI
jgi:hypothetical protein